jgi:RNA polymerase sigma-70 factor, ECF subfamily
MLTTAPESDWGRLRADVTRLVRRRLPGGADLDDVVQDVLLRIWRHAGSIRDAERFGSWLATVASNAAAEHLRGKQRHPVAASAAANDYESAAPVDAADDDLNAKTMVAAILRPFAERLSATYREAIVLSELEGLPHSEIAARLGLSVSGVKSRVQRGREQLRKMVTDCCQLALDARGGVIDCEPRPGGTGQSDCRCEPGGKADRH